MGDSLLTHFGDGNLFSFFSRNKRSTIVFAGAFVAAGAITTVSVQAQSDPTPTTNHIDATIHTRNNNPNAAANQDIAAPSDTVSNTTTTPSGSSHEVNLQVNGQNIPVPADGTSEQTVPSSDGQTLVTLNSNSDGSSSNSSTSSLNINISSGGSSSQSRSSTVITQNGGTTVIKSD